MDVAERITITIPDNLYERLQVVKEKLNVSGVCQKAIEQAVQIEEIKLRTDIPGKEKAIIRLRKEKQEAGAHWKNTGFKDGVEDAEEFSYLTIKGLVSPADTIPIEIFEAAYEESFPFERVKKYIKEYDDFVEEAYEEGWFDGIIHFWEEVKNQL